MLEFIRKKLILIIIQGSFTALVFGQERADINRLFASLDKISIEEQVDTLNELAWLYRSIDRDSAILLAESACQLAKNNHYPIGLSDGYARLGVLFYLQKTETSFQKAKEYYLKSLEVREKEKDFVRVAQACNNLGLLHYRMGEMEKSKQYYRKALESLKQRSSVKTEGRALSGLAKILVGEKNYKEAIKVYEQAYELRAKAQDTLGMAHSLMDQAILYHELNADDTNLELLHKSLSFYKDQQYQLGEAKCYTNIGNHYFNKENFPKAKEYYQKTLGFESILSNFSKSIIYENLGSIYANEEKLDSSLFFYKKSLPLVKESGSAKRIASLFQNLGKTNFYFNGNLDTTKYYLEQSLSISQENSFQEIEMEVSLALADVSLKQRNEQKFLDYSKKYQELRNKINNEKTEAFNLKDSLQIKRIKIQKLENENAIQKSESQRKTILIISLIGLIVFINIIGFSIYLNYRSQKRKKEAEQREKEARQREKEAQLQVDHMIQQQELKITSAKLYGEDQERQRLAKELHDGLGALLSAIKMNFENLGKKVDFRQSETKDRYGKSTELLGDACKEVRRISHGMHLALLTKFGLADQIEGLIETINESGQLEAQFINHKFNRRLSRKYEVNLYRVIQELVANVLKHAKAQKLIVELSCFGEENLVSVIVQDDGIGFDLDKADKNKESGIGLMNMKARIADMDGLINFDSSIGKGTTVTIDVPLKKVSEEAVV